MYTAIQQYYQAHGCAFIVLMEYDAIAIKVKKALENEEIRQFPSLYDNVHYGELSPSEQFEALINKDLHKIAFYKPECYAYQQELCIFIRCNPIGDHADIYLGDLKPHLLYYGEFKPDL